MDPLILRRRAIRALPWLVALALPGLLAGRLWPHQVRSWAEARARAGRLETAAADPASLRNRIEALAADSLRLERDLARLRERSAGGSDPASEAAARLAPILDEAGWGLLRLEARRDSSRVRVRAGANLDFPHLVEGCSRLEAQPVPVRLERLALRPSPSGGLDAEFAVSVPAQPGETR